MSSITNYIHFIKCSKYVKIPLTMLTGYCKRVHIKIITELYIPISSPLLVVMWLLTISKLFKTQEHHYVHQISTRKEKQPFWPSLRIFDFLLFCTPPGIHWERYSDKVWVRICWKLRNPLLYLKLCKAAFCNPFSRIVPNSSYHTPNVLFFRKPITIEVIVALKG